MAKQQKKTLMRSLGEFVGHIVRGVRTDPARREIRREVHQQQRTGSDGSEVVLRRTTIEEIEVRPPQR